MFTEINMKQQLWKHYRDGKDNSVIIQCWFC